MSADSPSSVVSGAFADLVRQLQSQLANLPAGTTVTLLAVTSPAPNAPAQDECLERPRTADEVAEFFQVRRETVQSWCREGRFAGAVQIPGAGWRIPVDSLRLSPALATDIAPPRVTGTSRRDQ